MTHGEFHTCIDGKKNRQQNDDNDDLIHCSGGDFPSKRRDMTKHFIESSNFGRDV